MIDDVDIKFPAMLDAALDGDYIWFSNAVANSLMKVSIKTGELVFFHVFDRYPLAERSLHQTITKVGDKLILTPDCGSRCIIVYDIHSGLEQYVEIPQEIINTSIIVDNELWMFPIRLNSKAWILNLGDYTIKENEQWRKMGNDNSRCTCVFRENRFFILLIGTNRIIEANREGKTKEHILDFGSRSFNTLAVIDSDLVISESIGYNIYRYNPDSKTSVSLYSTQNYLKDDYIVKLFVYGEWIVAIKKFELNTICVNHSTLHERIMDYSKDYLLKERDNMPFYSYRAIAYGESWLILPVAGKRIIQINPRGNSVIGIPIRVSEEWIKTCCRWNIDGSLRDGCLLHENVDYGLCDYVRALK